MNAKNLIKIEILNRCSRAGIEKPLAMQVVNRAIDRFERNDFTKAFKLVDDAVNDAIRLSNNAKRKLNKER